MKYVDTSAFVKYYSTEDFEKGAKKVAAIIDNAYNKREVLVASALLLGEVVSAFDKWYRVGAVNKNQLDSLVKELFYDIKELTERGTLIFDAIDPAFPLFAVELILKHHISVNDAIHLYTALLHSDKITEFVGSDKNLINAARAEGIAVFNPEE